MLAQWRDVPLSQGCAVGVAAGRLSHPRPAQACPCLGPSGSPRAAQLGNSPMKASPLGLSSLCAGANLWGSAQPQHQGQPPPFQGLAPNPTMASDAMRNYRRKSNAVWQQPNRL